MRGEAATVAGAEALEGASPGGTTGACRPRRRDLHGRMERCCIIGRVSAVIVNGAGSGGFFVFVIDGLSVSGKGKQFES